MGALFQYQNSDRGHYWIRRNGCRLGDSAVSRSSSREMAQNVKRPTPSPSMDARRMDSGLWIIREPWAFFPDRRLRSQIQMRHFDLRKSILVHHLVFLDHFTFPEEERRERVNLVGSQ
jgi:hypothetical protein